MSTLLTNKVFGFLQHLWYDARRRHGYYFVLSVLAVLAVKNAKAEKD